MHPEMRQHYVKFLWRSVYGSVAMFGIALIDTALWKLNPSPWTLTVLFLGWGLAWFKVNLTLAYAERCDLLDEATRDDDAALINTIGRVPITTHAADLMLFREPAERYKR